MKTTMTEKICRAISDHAREKKIANAEIARKSGHPEKVVSRLLSNPPVDAPMDALILLAYGAGMKLTFQLEED